MKPSKLFVPLVFSCVVNSCFAQSIEADLTGGLSFQHFTDNELVSPKRRGKTSIGNEITANIYYTFPADKKGLHLRTGIGYSEHNMQMNKSAFLDLFYFLFLFGNPDRDSFRLTQVKFKGQYLNVPVGASWTLTKNEKQRVQFYAGLQLNAGLLTGKNATLTFDETYVVPTPAEKEQAKKQYENEISKFTLGIQPRLDMQIRIFKNAGIQFGLWPVFFYANSWNRKIATSSFSFGSTMGIQYKF